MSISALPGENKTNKILYFCPRKHYYLIKIRHKTHFSNFCHLNWQLIQLSVFQLPTVKKYSKCQPNHRYRDVSPVVDSVSMMFCSRPIQTLMVTFWIHQHSWRSFGWHSATWQSNLVIDWLLGTTGPKIQNLLKFFCSLQCTYCLFWFSQVVRKHTLGKVKTKMAVLWSVVSKIFAP